MEQLKKFLQGQWLKHPLHPALVHVPTAVWPAALFFDLLANLGIGGNLLVQMSFYAILLGLLVALLAIPTGLADFADIRREKPAWKIGITHMILNLVISALWIVNLALRIDTFTSANTVPLGLLALSLASTLMLFVSGYLGGRMIYAYGINVARSSKHKWRQIAIEGGSAVPGKQ